MKYILTLVFVLQLFACSGGSGGTGLGSDTGAGIGAVSDVLSLSWVAPSEREDGTALYQAEIYGYRIYYGAESGNYQQQIDINDSSADQVQLDNLSSGVYYAVMTTIDVDGRESSYSQEVVITI